MQVELKNLRLNIPQLKEVVDNSIKECYELLTNNIRTIGLKEKIQKRKITLEKIQKILSEHSDI